MKLGFFCRFREFSEFFGSFVFKFLAGLSKLQLTINMPAGTFWGDFSEKDFFPPPVFERKIVGFLAKFFRQVCQACILLLHRHCLRIFVSFQNLVLWMFLFIERKISGHVTNFVRQVDKTAFWIFRTICCKS